MKGYDFSQMGQDTAPNPPTPPDPKPVISADGSVKLTDKVAKNRARFLDWLRTYNPEVFTAVVQRAENWKNRVTASTGNPAALSGLGLGDTAPSDWWSEISNGITSLGTAYLAYKGQQNIITLNTQRAAVGLPPLDPTTGAPTVNTTVGLSPQLMSRLQSSGTLLLYGGLAIAGVILFSNLLKKGRR